MASRVSIELRRVFVEGYMWDLAFDLTGLRAPLDSSYTVVRSRAG
jgi:hypothetical protein